MIPYNVTISYTRTMPIRNLRNMISHGGITIITFLSLAVSAPISYNNSHYLDLGESEYVFLPHNLTWHEAAAACQQNYSGFNLVVISNSTEKTAIEGYFNYSSWWMGVSYSVRTVFGDSLNFFDWSAAAVNASTSQVCTFMNAANGPQWQVANCNTLKPALCERQAPHSTTITTTVTTQKVSSSSSAHPTVFSLSQYLESDKYKLKKCRENEEKSKKADLVKIGFLAINTLVSVILITAGVNKALKDGVTIELHGIKRNLLKAKSKRKDVPTPNDVAGKGWVNFLHWSATERVVNGGCDSSRCLEQCSLMDCCSHKTCCSRIYKRLKANFTDPILKKITKVREILQLCCRSSAVASCDTFDGISTHTEESVSTEDDPQPTVSTIKDGITSGERQPATTGVANAMMDNLPSTSGYVAARDGFQPAEAPVKDGIPAGERQPATTGQKTSPRKGSKRSSKRCFKLPKLPKRKNKAVKSVIKVVKMVICDASESEEPEDDIQDGVGLSTESISVSDF